MTAVFEIADGGNGTIYYRKTKEEIDSLIDDYERGGWIVSLRGYRRDTDTITYELSD